MSAESESRWHRVKAIFAEAVRLLPSQHAAHVNAATSDVAVRAEVLGLLAAHEATCGFLDPPELRLLDAGHRLGPYEIRAHLGGGGMGEVYRALDTRLGREVAVKVLHSRLGDDRARGRFEREARAIAALSHPNVLALHDLGDEDGLAYLVTELLVGETLRARLARGPLPLAQALEVTIQIAHGLAAAHAQGIVHRDLKPANVFLLDDGRVKILDFGLARTVRGEVAELAATQPGMIVGTAGYLAPEQARALPAAATADLFALGAILFELLAGTRAFLGDDIIETLHLVVTHEPPPPSSLRPEVPRWLDRVVARCLEKEPARRFQSALDLAFALGTPVEAAPAGGRRRGRGWMAVAATAAFVAAPWPRDLGGPTPQPARRAAVTFSGRDSDPAVSPDGRFLAFASDRDGRSRIWLRQLEGGGEAPLTDGPDETPRFSPDGGQLLFTRNAGGATSLYRVSLLGGDVTRVADDASDGDWAPDGRRVVFARWRDGGTQAVPAIVIAGVDGSGAHELGPLDFRLRIRPRWSPDGRTIAVSGVGQQPGTPQRIVLLPVDGSPARTLPAPRSVGLVSAVAWDGPGALLYAQALSVTGNWAGGGARVVRQRVEDGEVTTLLWNLETSFVVDRWPGRGLVYDARSPRQNLREVRLGGGETILSRGTTTDRQPVYSPDGAEVVFSSHRGGDLDIWSVARDTGATQRLTDDAAEDWDPSLSPDGRLLLWSSNRSGTFEIWMAEADGSRPRQVTHDGDAENPSLTPDGRWLIYASGAPSRAGIWRVRPDGSDAVRLVPGVILPEISPDGRHVLFQTNRSPRRAAVGVVRVADGVLEDFEIRVDVERLPTPALGRARWMPDGRAIAFLGQDREGRTGVFVQRFAPGEDTTAERRPLAGFASERTTESFGIGPGGDRVVLAEWEQRSEVVAATGL